MRAVYAAAIAVAASAMAAIAAASYEEAGADGSHVRIAVLGNIGHAAPIVGLERGIFAASLPNMTVQTAVFDSGSQAIESLFSGYADFAYVGPGPAVNGFVRAQENPVIILGGAASGGASLMAHPDSQISGPQDLSGKRVAAPQIANTQDVSLRHYLAQNKLVAAERGGTVYVINIANPDIYSLFSKGELDAAWVPEPWATAMEGSLGGKRVFSEEELWPDGQFSTALLVTLKEYAEQNPETVSAVVSAHKRAVSEAASDLPESGRTVNAFLERETGIRLPDRIVAESLSRMQITADPMPETVDEFARRADSLGYLGRHGYSLDGIFYTGGEK